MSPRTIGIRRITITSALLCLGAGLTASAAGTASAATGTHTTTTHTASALVRSAPATLILANPGTVQCEPDTTVTLTIKSTDSIAGATQDFSATGLPPGITIDSSTGVISGTTGPTIASYDVTVSDTDSNGDTASIQFTWNVWNDIRIFTPSGIYTVGTPAPANDRVLVSDSGGSDFTFTFSASGLPSGLSLNSSTGVISGTPTTVGEGRATITVTDGTGSTGSTSYGWIVNGNVTVNMSAQRSTAGQTVALPVSVTDDPPTQLTYFESGLPPGLSLNGSEITGWPTTPGTYSVTITVFDQNNGSGAATFTWTVTSAADSGPSGPVHLNLDDKCLDDTGDKSTNGNKVQIWTCNGGSAQKWTYAEDGTLRINGKCLDIVNKSTSSGAKVQLWTCTGAANQQWVPAGHSEFRNPVSGRCLDDTGQSTKNGTQPDIWGCSFVAWREWTLPAGPVLSAIPGRCLDDLSGSTANGAKVGAYTCNGSGPQKWTVEPDGTIRVNGKCLDDNGDSSAAGAKIQLWTCSDSDKAEQWGLLTGDSLGFQLSHGSLCATPTSMAAANGAQLVLGACDTDEANWHAW